VQMAGGLPRGSDFIGIPILIDQIHWEEEYNARRLYIGSLEELMS
jgi:hypothetical protein